MDTRTSRVAYATSKPIVSANSSAHRDLGGGSCPSAKVGNKKSQLPGYSTLSCSTRLPHWLFEDGDHPPL